MCFSSSVTSSHQHYKQYFPDRPRSDSNTRAKNCLLQPEDWLKITICKMTISSPIRRHDINCDSVCTGARSAFRHLRLLFPLAGCMKRGCQRPVTVKIKQTNTHKKNPITKHTDLKLGFFYFYLFIYFELRTACKRKDNKQTLWVDDNSVALCCSLCPRWFFRCCFVNPPRKEAAKFCLQM